MFCLVSLFEQFVIIVVLYVTGGGVVRVALVSLMLPLSLALADFETQTDWSGGPHFWEPQSYWASDFYVDTDVSWRSPGIIELDPVEQTVCPAVGFGNPIHIEDINGDGALDVLGGSNTYDEVVWWENVDGVGISWQKHVVNNQCSKLRSIYSADVNGDGFMDILGASNGDDELLWWENGGDGTTWQEHLVVSDFSDAVFVFAADIDGDGDVDIFGSATMETELTWWENTDGSGTNWAEHVVDSSLYGVAVYVEDINGDGFMDIVGVEVGPKKFTWWENVDGTATSWIEHPLPESFSNSPSSVHAKDINGDGFMDIIGSDWAVGDDVFWWENLDGSGEAWTKHYVDNDFSAARYIRAADIDLDGYIDIFGAASSASDQVVLWTNSDGSGTEWIKSYVDDSFGSAGMVCSGDINGDGYLDIAGSQYSGKIAWWDVQHYIPTAGLESILLDTQCHPVWGNLEWDAITPAGTTISLQVRSMDSPDTPTAWSDSLWEPCSLQGILNDGSRFVQYRVNLCTIDAEVSPVVNDISIYWNNSGIQASSPSGSFVLGSLENPSRYFATIGFVLEESTPVDFYVYDLMGRVVRTESFVKEAGYGEVIFSDLTPGLYLVHISSNSLEFSHSFVIIE
ncbi:MAG: T9SS type A sorting domain-containing protein [Candidatus Sabulitectum sp.]|nr:T9SS type A sorting domain-containing protein [Candidatus Sabulitectum sp.]